MNMVGRGCCRVLLVLNAGRARGRLRFAVWTGDLGFVKAGACVGLGWGGCGCVLLGTVEEVTYLRKSRRWIFKSSEALSYAFDRIRKRVKWGRVTVRGIKEKRILIKICRWGECWWTAENGAKWLPLSLGWDEVYWRSWSGRPTESLLSLTNNLWMVSDLFDCN